MSKKKRKNKADAANPVGSETPEALTQTSEAIAVSTSEPEPSDAAPQETPPSLVPEAENPPPPDVAAIATDAPPCETGVASVDEPPYGTGEPSPEACEAAVALSTDETIEPSGPAEGLHISAPDEPLLEGEDVAEAPIEVGEGLGELSTERVVEAILFTSDAPLTLPKIVSIMGTGSAREVRKIIQGLNKEYAKTGNSFRIDEIAGGFQMLTMPEYNTWLRRLRESRQDSKLSPAAMETLAVVAYKQPVVRAEIESIRGVSAGETLNRLRELGLVKIVGRAEDVGRPMLYGTTKHFLEVFGLSSLEDLPAVEELQAPK